MAEFDDDMFAEDADEVSYDDALKMLDDKRPSSTDRPPKRQRLSSDDAEQLDTEVALLSADSHEEPIEDPQLEPTTPPLQSRPWEQLDTPGDEDIAALLSADSDHEEPIEEDVNGSFILDQCAASGSEDESSESGTDDSIVVSDHSDSFDVDVHRTIRSPFQEPCAFGFDPDTYIRSLSFNDKIEVLIHAARIDDVHLTVEKLQNAFKMNADQAKAALELTPSARNIQIASRLSSYYTHDNLVTKLSSGAKRRLYGDTAPKKKKRHSNKAEVADSVEVLSQEKAELNPENAAYLLFRNVPPKINKPFKPPSNRRPPINIPSYTEKTPLESESADLPPIVNDWAKSYISRKHIYSQQQIDAIRAHYKNLCEICIKVTKCSVAHAIIAVDYIIKTLTDLLPTEEQVRELCRPYDRTSDAFTTEFFDISGNKQAADWVTAEYFVKCNSSCAAECISNFGRLCLTAWTVARDVTLARGMGYKVVNMLHANEHGDEAVPSQAPQAVSSSQQGTKGQTMLKNITRLRDYVPPSLEAHLEVSPVDISNYKYFFFILLGSGCQTLSLAMPGFVEWQAKRETRDAYHLNGFWACGKCDAIEIDGHSITDVFYASIVANKRYGSLISHAVKWEDFLTHCGISCDNAVLLPICNDEKNYMAVAKFVYQQKCAYLCGSTFGAQTNTKLLKKIMKDVDDDTINTFRVLFQMVSHKRSESEISQLLTDVNDGKIDVTPTKKQATCQLFAKENGLVSFIKHLRQYIDWQERPMSTLTSHNRGRIAVQLAMRLYKLCDIKTDVVSRDGPNITQTDIDRIVVQWLNKPSPVIALLMHNNINPYTFYNQFVDLMIIGGNRGDRRRWIFSGDFKCGKSMLAQAIGASLNGVTLKMTASSARDWITADVRSSNGVVLIEDSHYEIQKYIDTELRMPIDGCTFVSKRFYQQPEKMKWPPIIETTNTPIKTTPPLPHPTFSAQYQCDHKKYRYDGRTSIEARKLYTDRYQYVEFTGKLDTLGDMRLDITKEDFIDYIASHIIAHCPAQLNKNFEFTDISGGCAQREHHSACKLTRFMALFAKCRPTTFNSDGNVHQCIGQVKNNYWGYFTDIRDIESLRVAMLHELEIPMGYANLNAEQSAVVKNVEQFLKYVWSPLCITSMLCKGISIPRNLVPSSCMDPDFIADTYYEDRLTFWTKFKNVNEIESFDDAELYLMPVFVNKCGPYGLLCTKFLAALQNHEGLSLDDLKDAIRNFCRKVTAKRVNQTIEAFKIAAASDPFVANIPLANRLFHTDTLSQCFGMCDPMTKYLLSDASAKIDIIEQLAQSYSI